MGCVHALVWPSVVVVCVTCSVVLVDPRNIVNIVYCARVVCRHHSRQDATVAFSTRPLTRPLTRPFTRPLTRPYTRLHYRLFTYQLYDENDDSSSMRLVSVATSMFDVDGGGREYFAGCVADSR